LLSACIADAVGTRRLVAHATLIASVEELFPKGEYQRVTKTSLCYNGQENDRTTAGITTSRVFRSADDQNDVVILADVADISKARAWLGSNDMKTVLEKSGVVGSPSIRFAA
jgi:hypothetical protein